MSPDDLLSVWDEHSRFGTINRTQSWKKRTTVKAMMAGVWHYTLAAVVLMCVFMWDPTEAVGGARSRPRPQRRPPKKPKVEPTEVTPLAQNIDMEQVRMWRRCRSHTEQGAQTFQFFNNFWLCDWTFLVLSELEVSINFQRSTFALLTNWLCCVSSWGNKP